jgi:thiol-disulfide isomerase/thioredoxin
MALLTAAVVVVGALCLVNLVLVLGVLRRLREHAERLDEHHGRHGGERDAPMASVDGTVQEFTAVADDGTPLSRGWLGGVVLVGFFSLSCKPCRDFLPRFVEAATRHPGGRAQTLAVVVGASDEAAAPFVAALRPVATLIREDEQGPVMTAFGVRGFPAFALVEEEGRVRASAFDIEALPAVTTR